MSELPPPPSEPPPPPGARPVPPPPTTYGSLPNHPAAPQWGPYAPPGEARSRFVWWESVLGAAAGIAGNIAVLLLPLAGARGGVWLLYNIGWIVVPLRTKHWSYAVGYVVGVAGAIALALVIVIYSCSSTYGGSGG